MKLVKVKLNTEKNFDNRDAEKLRGFFGRTFQQEILFHNHKTKFEFNYDFSFIQYKIIDKKLTLVGIDRGGDILLKEISNVKKVLIGEEEVQVKPEINITFPDLFIAENLKYRYRFESIWLALNNENFLKYKKGSLDLNKQLANNILEFFKMCGIWVEKRIEVKGCFKEFPIKQKDTIILGFVGEFWTNAHMPDDISLGKRKSIGMGRIKKIEEGEING